MLLFLIYIFVISNVIYVQKRFSNIIGMQLKKKKKGSVIIIIIIFWFYKYQYLYLYLAPTRHLNNIHEKKILNIGCYEYQ